MPRFAIIADDLTGALDAAAPFAGIPGGVVVATDTESLGDALACDPGVVSVSTRSREIGAQEAGARVARLLAALPAGIGLFKKIDSRLKGNVAAELAAFGARPMLVAPAIPEFGRIVRDGALQGFGVDHPVPVRPVLGPAAERADVPDTATAAEMAAAVARGGADTVFVGARGLAVALAFSLGIVPAPSPPLLPQPLCISVGSTDPITLRQIEALRHAIPSLTHIEAPSGRVRSGIDGPLPPVSLIQMCPGEGISAARASRRFADCAAPWLRKARSIVLSGGVTAETCLDAIGISLLAVRGEILPGLPLSEAAGRLVVSKSGGFGEPDTLLRLTGLPVVVRA